MCGLDVVIVTISEKRTLVKDKVVLVATWTPKRRESSLSLYKQTQTNKRSVNEK